MDTTSQDNMPVYDLQFRLQAFRGQSCYCNYSIIKRCWLLVRIHFRFLLGIYAHWLRSFQSSRSRASNNLHNQKNGKHQHNCKQNGMTDNSPVSFPAEQVAHYSYHYKQHSTKDSNILQIASSTCTCLGILSIEKHTECYQKGA